MAQRNIGIAVDFSAGSKHATAWALRNVVRDEDQVILLVVIKKQKEVGASLLWEDTGSPFVPLDSYADNALSQYGIKRDDELLDLLKTEAPQKDNVVFKVYWGDAREKICDAVTDLPLNFLVMGSRGLGPLKRTLLGSVSNYVVNSAACPVTVVKALFDGTSHGAK